MATLPPVAFFSFPQITDPSQHRAFNEYHQLDHRPANLALPGVYYGERFVRTPRCAAASVAPDPRYGHAHYLAYYLFRDATPQTRAEWIELGSLAAYWGRKPDHAWSSRTVGFYRTLKGWASPRVRVPPEVVPMRPARGIHATVTELAGDPAVVDELGRWLDTERAPAVLALDGVAGLMTFVSEDGFPVTRVAAAEAGARPTLVTLAWLDGDPVEVAGAVAALAGPPGPAAEGGRLLFEGPFETITPWSWDWFDQG